MTFEQFLFYIRSNVDKHHSDGYWLKQYDILKAKTEKAIMDEMPYLAVRSTSHEYFKYHHHN